MSAPLFVVAPGMAIALLGAHHAGSSRADEANGLRCSVAPVGDVDGDGAADFALARRGSGPRGFGGPPGAVAPGAVWVFSGNEGKRLRTLDPPEPCADFGRALDCVGDVDCDGTPNLAIAGGGRVWLFEAKDGRVLRELAGDLASPGFGHSLAGGLDADGDGCSDVLVYRAENVRRECPQSGVVLLYSGKTGDLIRVFGCGAKPSFTTRVPEERYTCVGDDALLPAIGLVPDRDADGRAEVAIAHGFLSSEECSWGHARRWKVTIEVLSSSRQLSLVKIRLPENVDDTGPRAWNLRALGDVTGDGVAEILVSIVHDYVLVFSGSTGGELQRLAYDGGYMEAEGTSLDVVGDVDGDGLPDFLIGANEDSMDCDPGFAALHSGADGLAIHALAFHDYDSDDCGIGVDACALGDANGDGICDVVVHMPRLREARVLSGKDLAVITKVDLSDLEPLEKR